MVKAKIDALAPDFTLNEFEGNKIALSAFRERENVLLVFKRGFI